MSLDKAPGAISRLFLCLFVFRLAATVQVHGG